MLIIEPCSQGDGASSDLTLLLHVRVIKMYFCTSNLDEEDGPELCPGLRLAQRPVAGQVCPFDGEDSVSHAHQQHARRKPHDVGGAEEEEGCKTETESCVTTATAHMFSSASHNLNIYFNGKLFYSV